MILPGGKWWLLGFLGTGYYPFLSKNYDYTFILIPYLSCYLNWTTKQTEVAYSEKLRETILCK
jgi:hypothetical protein